jgi:hypothetical protein
MANAAPAQPMRYFTVNLIAGFLENEQRLMAR